MFIKKYTILTIALLISILLLSACGNNKKEEEAKIPDGSILKPEQGQTVDKSQTNHNQEKDFGFRNFKLKVDKKDSNDSVIVDYHADSTGTEAIYKNIQADTNLQGDAAFELLQPIFMDLQLTKDMSEKEVIEKVLSVFDVSEYKNFNLEVEYDDGENKTYNNFKQ